jgi:hypothetical protein
VGTYTCDVILWRSVFSCVFRFVTFARFNCIAQVRVEHVVFENGGMSVTFPASKTDQYRMGQTIFVAATGTPYCPVVLTKRYILRMAFERKIEDRALLFDGFLVPGLSTTKFYYVEGRKYFYRKVENQLSYEVGMRHSRLLLVDIGVADPDAYAEHSGRRGGASAAALAGQPADYIKRHGRWTNFTSPQAYVDEALMYLSGLTLSLGL